MSNVRNLGRRILGPYRISHHPLCNHFSDHVYLIRGNKICRGCAMQYSGMVASFVIIFIGNLPFFRWWYGLTEIQIGLVLYIMILPTILTAFFLDNRIAKDIARFLLGASFTLAFILLIFTPDWLIKIWILINFLPGYIYLNKRRAVKNTEICTSCIEYKKIPYCSGYQVYIDRENIFLSQAAQGGVYDPFSLSPDQLDD